MTRRFDLSREGAFVPADHQKPGKTVYDSAGRRVAERNDQRLLFADELPEQPGLEDILVVQVARAWTWMSGSARRVAPAAVAGGAWATSAVAQVPAATLCQAATLCVLTAVGGSTLHYYQKSHPAKVPLQAEAVFDRSEPAHIESTQVERARVEQARIEQASPEPVHAEPAMQLADATPVAAAEPLPEAPIQAAAPEAVTPQAVAQLPAEPVPAEPVPAETVPAEPVRAEPATAPAQALSPRQQLPLSSAAQDADADMARAPLAGATVQKATILAKADAIDDAPAAEDDVSAPISHAAASRSAPPVHSRAAKLSMRSAPVLHAMPTMVRVAPPVIMRLVQLHRPAPHVVMARFDMPHWLTETHTAHPAVVLSARPHALATPHEDHPVLAADTDHDSDKLNVPVAEEAAARPVLAAVPHRDRFANAYGRSAYYQHPAYYPRPAYYPPSAYYQPYGYPYGSYGYPYGRY